jgi:hypothetical protein
VGAEEISGSGSGGGEGGGVGSSESFFTTVVYLRISCDKDDFIWTVGYKQYKTHQIDFNLTGIITPFIISNAPLFSSNSNTGVQIKMCEQIV